MGNPLILRSKHYFDEQSLLIKQKFAQYSRKPGLATILLGDDPASHIYVQSKINVCKYIGAKTKAIYLPENVSQIELLEIIDRLNNDNEIDGILVQLPFPKHINVCDVLEAISPLKDVDCFHPINLGRLFCGNSNFAPATPRGIMILLESIKNSWQFESKHAVLIGASNIVGKPLSVMLLHKGMTVSLVHKKTLNIEVLCKNADLIVSAAGQVNLVKREMVKEGAVLIDVGINRTNTNIVGDIDFEGVKDLAFAITPVPGGVGPMTILAVLQNLDFLYKNTNEDHLH